MLKDVKAVVVLSGGLDSTVALFKAIEDFGLEHVAAVSFHYNQRHQKEIACARNIMHAIGRGAFHQTIHNIPLPQGEMLTSDAELPNCSYDEIQGVSPTYVSFRNGTFLSIAAAWASHWGAEAVYAGMHAEDAKNWAYPDCTPEFLGAMCNAIFIGTYQKTRLITPLMHMQKWEIVSLGRDLAAPLDLTWSCYAGGEKHCGTCPTCRSRKEAFRVANIADPTIYAA